MTRSGITTLTCAGILSVAVGLGIASAQTSPTAEHRFVPQAALANMAEIQLGHMAVKKAQNADVKKFAQMMIDDHVKTQNALADAAYGAGIQWPKQLDEKHRQLQQRLSTLSNEQFDHEYMKAVVDGQRDIEKMLAARVGEGGTALAAKVNQWAGKTLPGVRAHLKQAEQIYGGLEKGA